MMPHLSDHKSSLAQQVAERVRATTHDRIRDLSVEEVQGHVVIHGHVHSHHTRQLALHAALELISGEQFRSLITVG